jgi:tellurite resistance protein
MNALPPNVPEKRNSRLLTVSTKVSLTDLSALEEKATLAGLTMSSFVRQAAVAGQVQPKTVIPTINRQDWGELGRLAGNVNQIAVRVNQGGEIGASDFAVLAEICRHLGQIRAAILGLEGHPHGLPN